MNNTTLEKITVELKNELIGQRFGRIFSLKKLQLAIDFRLNDSKFLFISLEPSAPRTYFIRRKLKELEKESKNPSRFVLFLRKRLSNAELKTVEKFENERIIKFVLSARTDLGQIEIYALIVQLTGRSANLFLLDKNDFILDSLRENSGAGQQIANKFSPPDRPENLQTNEKTFPQNDFETLSEALTFHYQKLDAEKDFQTKAKSAQSKINAEIKKREKLVKKLKQDLENHGDAEKWKRFGDLILANLANAERREDKIIVTDYFDENLPQIEIQAEENLSLTKVSEKYFKRYTKARNAKTEISKRLSMLNTELEKLLDEKAEIETAIAEKNAVFFNFEVEPDKGKSKKLKNKILDSKSKARNFTSSEGFEILVGKGAKDNDHLTFRVAKSNDLWLHAADYPGSHVVVKSRNREEIPNKTLIEAAQLAAFYSQAREELKVAVHYTLRKFVHKPKGAVAGLVNLASFKTILVEPKIVEKTED
ncbi:MAG: Rqc2 family fibronectin-binding protein [Pyrinomonadaceae bacterium]